MNNLMVLGWRNKKNEEFIMKNLNLALKPWKHVNPLNFSLQNILINAQSLKKKFIKEQNAVTPNNTNLV